MPTGYTNILDDRDDVTLTEFIWRCAHAFAAEADLNAPLENLKVDDYHQQRLVEAKADLAALQNLKPIEVWAREESEWKRRYAEWADSMQRNAEERRRYIAMREKVEAWDVPSEIRALKKFMLEQLRIGMPADYANSEWMEEPKRMSPSDWLGAALERAHADVAYAIERLAEAQKRVDNLNEWLAELRAAVPPSARRDE